MLGIFGGKSASRPDPSRRRLLLAADPAAADALIDWAYSRVAILSLFPMVGVGDVAKRLVDDVALECKALRSMAHGGDAEFYAEILKGDVHAVFAFVDASAGALDTRQILRLSALVDAPTAFSAPSADLIATSPLFSPTPTSARAPTPSPESLAASVKDPKA